MEEDAPAAPDELKTLLSRAAEGDRTALALFCAMASDGALTEQFGPLVEMARLEIAGRLVGPDNLPHVHGLKERSEQLQRELAGPSPSPLVWLLAEAASVCWLHYYSLETLAAVIPDEDARESAWRQNAVNAAHKRYLRSLRELHILKEKQR